MNVVRRCSSAWYRWPFAYRVAASIVFAAGVGQISNLVAVGRWGLS